MPGHDLTGRCPGPADDVQDLRTQWALLLDSALLHLHGVELALWRLLPDDVQRTLELVLS